MKTSLQCAMFIDCYVLLNRLLQWHRHISPFIKRVSVKDDGKISGPGTEHIQQDWCSDRPENDLDEPPGATC